MHGQCLETLRAAIFPPLFFTRFVLLLSVFFPYTFVLNNPFLASIAFFCLYFSQENSFLLVPLCVPPKFSPKKFEKSVESDFYNDL